jgi:hypothetical protein
MKQSFIEKVWEFSRQSSKSIMKQSVIKSVLDVLMILSHLSAISCTVEGIVGVA